MIFLSNYLKIPSVILSDSRFKDHKRNVFKELIKIILLKGVSSALVAGIESNKIVDAVKIITSNPWGARYDFNQNGFLPSNVVLNSIASNIKNYF